MRIFVLWQYTELYMKGDSEMVFFGSFYTLLAVGFGVLEMSTLLLI